MSEIVNDSMIGEEEMRELPSDDKIRILVASDIHVGYGEKIADRHMDSVASFEEVLKDARDHNADFILLGGDLFHENNPSRDMQHRVTRLLRRYCFSDRQVSVQFVSDPSTNFGHSLFPWDSNLNVGMPLFTIHGNHDDLAGKGLSALDLLHEAGLLNLFGKFSDIQHYEVSPILLRKGETRIALYGISSQRDDRLARAFINEDIKFMRPQEETDAWFNILVLHQNRPRRSTARSTGAFLPEQYIPSFFDLVIWGHEHECKPDPQYVECGEVVGNGFYILQPGSTIATSLRPEEAVPKHCFLLTVKGKKFRSRPIPLETPRRVLFADMKIDQFPARYKPPPVGSRIAGMPDEGMIISKVEDMLTETQPSQSHSRQSAAKLPLVRLRVTYGNEWLKYPPLNGRRFGASRFVDRVANPMEMLLIRHNDPDKKNSKANVDRQAIRAGDEVRATVEDLVTSYFSTASLEQKLMVLSETHLQRALNEYLDGSGVGADRALAEAVEGQANHMRAALKRVDRGSDGAAIPMGDLDEQIRKEIALARRGRLEKANGGGSGTLQPALLDDMEMTID